MASRGIPEHIFDNAQTFKVAAAQLTRIFNDPGVMSFLLKRKANGSLILRKPHGGWVRGVGVKRMNKRTKRCLRKTLGKARLTYEELFTVLT